MESLLASAQPPKSPCELVLEKWCSFAGLKQTTERLHKPTSPCECARHTHLNPDGRQRNLVFWKSNEDGEDEGHGWERLCQCVLQADL